MPVPINADLVGRLLQAQFPAWSRLPITPVASTGTDNAIFRIGTSMAARLPKVDWAVGQSEREHRWLPHLAPHLPLAIPHALALGEPAEAYPWPWSIHRWIDGDSCTPATLDGTPASAETLAAFLTALRGIAARDGPRSGPANHHRGIPLARRDTAVRAALARLRGEPYMDAAASAWADALAAEPAAGAPCWLHGDLQPANLIVSGGRLAAVIDFGLMGVGDPACDLMAAWTCFSEPARQAFRGAMQAGRSEWMRGRGWAVSTALVALAAYRETNPGMAAAARWTIQQVAGNRPSAPG